MTEGEGSIEALTKKEKKIDQLVYCLFWRDVVNIISDIGLFQLADDILMAYNMKQVVAIQIIAF